MTQLQQGFQETNDYAWSIDSRVANLSSDVSHLSGRLDGFRSKLEALKKEFDKLEQIVGDIQLIWNCCGLRSGRWSAAMRS